MNSRTSYLIAAASGLAAWILAAWIIARLLFGTALYPGEPLRGGWSPAGLAMACAGLVLALILRAIFRHHGDDRAPALPALSRRADHQLTAVVLVVHALLAGAMSWDLPLFEGPDESTHFDYARYIASEGRLPALHIDGRALESDVAIDQKIQPPFYYLCLAPALWAVGATEWSTFYQLAPPRDASHWPASWKAAKYQHGADEIAPYRGDVLTLHLLRLSGIAFTLLALLGLRRALRTLRFARSTTLAVVAIFGCLPQLVHLAGVFSNDLPAIAAGTWSVALASRFTRQGYLSRRSAFALGIWLGVFVLAKLSGAVVLAWMPCVALAHIIRHRRWRALFKAASFALLGFAAASGWYWTWNWIEYGHPVQNWVYQTHYQATGDLGLEAWTHWGILFPGTFGLSFLCDLGWMAAWPRPVALWIIAALAAPLVMAQFSRRGIENVFAHALTSRLLVIVLFLLAWIAQLKFYAAVFQPQGRHHFPFLICYAMGLACALEALRYDVGAKAARFAYTALPLAALLFAAHAWLFVLREQFALDAAEVPPYFAITDAHARGTATESIEVIGPISGAGSVTAPTLQWVAEPGERYSIEIGLDGTMSGPSWSIARRVVRSFEHLQIELEGDQFTIPEAAWVSFFPPGREVVWRVRRLNDVRDGKLCASVPRTLHRSAP